MSVMAFDRSSTPEGHTPDRYNFWRGLAQTLDCLAAYPVKHAVSETELQRVADDIERCRRLMFKPPEHLGSAQPFADPSCGLSN
ncbi:MAG: hypothetical protein ABSE22_18910 [Xanthobacteraceae bacterium]|jgi:hypothetical protein